MTTTTITDIKLAGNLKEGDKVLVHDEIATVHSPEIFETQGVKQVEFILAGPGWNSAVVCNAGDAVYYVPDPAAPMPTVAEMDAEEDADWELTVRQK